MSGSLMTMFSSPTQAANIFSQNGQFPKQRHVFLVRFLTNALSVSKTTSGLTYALKSVDRPSIQPHSEELNQYNKKRHIYTGYKINPLKMSFYDTADSAAMRMWADYTKYYFGDFNQSGPAMFSGRDIYGSTLDDNAGSYGFTANNGGKTDTDSQFFFTTITILHFYNGQYDSYTLVNPRIVSFNPDELDYGEANVATINVEFVYEALLFTPLTGQSASSVPEFEALFNGYQYEPPISSTSSWSNQYSYDPTLNSSSGTSSLTAGLFSGVTLNSGITSSNFRLLGSASGTGLGVFGNFSFGASSIGGINFGANISGNLAAAAINNPALASTLNLQYAGQNPLAYSGGSLATANLGLSSLPSAQLSIANTQVNALLSAPSTFQQPLTQGITASSLLGGNGFSTGGNGGAVLSPSAYSLINSQSPGYSQIGFNPNTTSSGQPYGAYAQGSTVAVAGSPLANALDANPNSDVTYNGVTYGPQYTVPAPAPSPPIEAASSAGFFGSNGSN